MSFQKTIDAYKEYLKGIEEGIIVRSKKAVFFPLDNAGGPECSLSEDTVKWLMNEETPDFLKD